jgi:hypothetical protein
MMAQDKPHVPTLMVDTQRAWLFIPHGTEPAQVELRCQECATCIDVDTRLARKGEYFCDGAGHYRYYKYQADRPGILEVVTGPTEIDEEARQQLVAILGGLEEVKQALEAWLYMHIRAH